MRIETEKLIRFRTYAERNNKTYAWVKQQEEKGLIAVVLIDGMKFVKV